MQNQVVEEWEKCRQGTQIRVSSRLKEIIYVCSACRGADPNNCRQGGIAISELKDRKEREGAAPPLGWRFMVGVGRCNERETGVKGEGGESHLPHNEKQLKPHGQNEDQQQGMAGAKWRENERRHTAKEYNIRSSTKLANIESRRIYRVRTQNTMNASGRQYEAGTLGLIEEHPTAYDYRDSCMRIWAACCILCAYSPDALPCRTNGHRGRPAANVDEL